MSMTTTDVIAEESDESATGSDADSESSSESTVVSVDINSDKITPLSPILPSCTPDNPTPPLPPPPPPAPPPPAAAAAEEKPENIEKPPIGDEPEGDKLRQSELARLRKVFQEKVSHDSETSSDCDKSLSRYDFSDAESVSSSELETSPRPKFLSDYTLDYIHFVPKRDTCDRDYMGTKINNSNRALRLKDRRKVMGKRREPYNLQTENKPKKSNYLTHLKNPGCSEVKKKQGTNHTNNAYQNIVKCENCPHETIDKFDKKDCLKPVTSKTKITDEETSTAHRVTADLRKYRMRTKIPMPKGRRDMEGIFKAADDQFNSLDSEISFFQDDMIDYETETFDKGHTLEVIEESSYETMSRDDVSDETLSNDTVSYGNNSMDDDIQEEASDTLLDRSEYTVELIEEALRDVSRQTQLEPIEEEQPFMIENRTLRNLVNNEINVCDEKLEDSEIRSFDGGEESFNTEQEEKEPDSEVKLDVHKVEAQNESTTKCESPTQKMLRVCLAKAAIMKYAAKKKQPRNESRNNRTVKHDNRQQSGSKSDDMNYQDTTDTDSDASNKNLYVRMKDVCHTKSTSDTETKVISHSSISTGTNRTDDGIVCGDNNVEVLSNMIKHIPINNLSLDDQCVVANISSQQYTVYIKLKKKDEGSSENHTPAAAEIQEIREVPRNMLKYVTCTDHKHCIENRSPNIQVNVPKTSKEGPKLETSQNKNVRLSSRLREKSAQPRIKKTKPTVNVIRSNKQRMKTDFPVLHERSHFHTMTNEDNIYEREVKRRLSKKAQEGRYNRKGSVPLQLHKSSTEPGSSKKWLPEKSASPIHKIPSLKAWLAMRQKLAFLGSNSTIQTTGAKMPLSKHQKVPELRHQTPTNVPNRKRPRLVPKLNFEKVVRETRSSLLRRLKEKSPADDSLAQKNVSPHKGGTPRKPDKKVNNTGKLPANQGDQPKSEKSRVPKEQPKARIGRMSPGFNRQCLDFIRPSAWQIDDSSSKFAFFCAPSYDTAKLAKNFDTSKYQMKSDSATKNSESPRTNDTTRPKKVDESVTAESKEAARREKAAEARRKVKEYLEKHRDINASKSPGLQRRALSKEEAKAKFPETKRIASTRSVDYGRRNPVIASDFRGVWSRAAKSCSQKCVMDAERLKAPIRQHLEEESILDKESIAKDALENVFKNLNAYLNALDSSSDSSLKTCPPIHFKHTTAAGDAVSSEDDLRADLSDDEEEMCGSDINFLLSGEELRLETVKHKIRKEPLVSDLKWSLLVAACHGYNFDKYLTPFPEHFLLNGRKDIDALMKATEAVPSLALLCKLSANEIPPSAVELLYWLLVELSSVKVMATSTREAEWSMSTRPDAVFSVWQQPSSMLDRRLRSNGRGLTKVEAFCCARLDKFHSLLHGGMVPSGVMRRKIDSALEMAKPGYGYGCSALGPRIKCVARCQVIVHPRLVELSEDTATVRGRNLVRVQQLLVFREQESQQTTERTNWNHLGKLLLVVLGLHMTAFVLLWIMWDDRATQPDIKRPDYSEAFPWLASL